MTPNGIVLVDKAEGWTSHDVVARSRRTLGTRKVGHAGTLDPMATGLLVLGVGPATKLLTYLVGLEKTYTARIRLGAETVTDDREGEITMAADPERVRAVSDERIQREVSRLTGDILQAPSAVSAIKVDGQRAYDRVRSGEDVQLKERPVSIREFALHAITRAESEGGHSLIDLDVTVTCSSGTYIRALARDLGRSLGVGGHLTELRRTRIGPFTVDQAVDVEHLDPARDLRSATHVATSLFEQLQLDADQAAALRHGKRLDVDFRDAKPVAAVDERGELIGLVSVKSGRVRVLFNVPTGEGSS